MGTEREGDKALGSIMNTVEEHLSVSALNYFFIRLFIVSEWQIVVF